MNGRFAQYWLWTLAAGGLVVYGCSSSSWWWVSGGSPDSPHELSETKPSSAQTADTRRAPGAGDSTQIVDIAFDFLRTELPIDSIRHSRKIWNHVDELRVDSNLSAKFARNGMRIGAASGDAWTAIRTILTACEAGVRHDRLVAQANLPVVVELGSIQSSESIFSYGADNRLAGKTFPGGSKLINLDYLVHPNLGGYVDLRVSFEVRSDRGVMTWERQGGVIRQVPDYDRHVFGDLSALIPLNEGEFLVVGPGDEADNEYLVGSRFFMERRGDKKYETILFITPLPYRVLDDRGKLR